MIQHITELQLAGSRRESIPGCAPDFPYTASESCLDGYVGRQVPWHWHEMFEFVFVREGALDYSTRAGTFTMRAGEGCLVNAGVLHTSRAHEGMAGVRYSVQQFGAEAVAGTERVLRRYVEPFSACAALEAMPLRREETRQREILEIMEAAFRCAADEPEGYEMEICAALSRAWRRVWALARPHLETQSVEPRPDSERVKKMLDYIHGHYAEDVKLSAIAAAAGVCAREGLRCFRQELDTTPIACLTDVRLRHAAQMLRESELSATQIATACGFASVSYFGKVFHRYMGMPPSAYRKR